MRPPGRLEDIRIVRAGDGYVVVNKPAGVLSVPGKGEANSRSVQSWVREHVPGVTGPITTHRLDMDTSGLLLVGTNEHAQRELSMQFERREVEKAYVAMVRGIMPAERGEIDVPMRLDPDRRPYQVVDRERGKPARTLWRVLGIEIDSTLLELVPLTGRTHQLRVHCAHIGHPIVGDVLYGAGGDESPRLMLHASRLAFCEPVGGRRVEVFCEPDFTTGGIGDGRGVPAANP